MRPKQWPAAKRRDPIIYGTSAGEVPGTPPIPDPKSSATGAGRCHWIRLPSNLLPCARVADALATLKPSPRRENNSHSQLLNRASQASRKRRSARLRSGAEAGGPKSMPWSPPPLRRPWPDTTRPPIPRHHPEEQHREGENRCHLIRQSASAVPIAASTHETLPLLSTHRDRSAGIPSPSRRRRGRRRGKESTGSTAAERGSKLAYLSPLSITDTLVGVTIRYKLLIYSTPTCGS